MLRDVGAYLVARLALAAVLTGVIIGAGRLVGLRVFRVVVGVLFAGVGARRRGLWNWAPRRRRATMSIAEFDERRRKDKETLQARLRGEDE